MKRIGCKEEIRDRSLALRVRCILRLLVSKFPVVKLQTFACSHASTERASLQADRTCEGAGLYIVVLAQLAAILPPFDARWNRDPRRGEKREAGMINYGGVTSKGKEWDQTKSDDGSSTVNVPREL